MSMQIDSGVFFIDFEKKLSPLCHERQIIIWFFRLTFDRINL